MKISIPQSFPTTDKAKDDPTFDMADGKFSMLDSDKGRTERTKDVKVQPLPEQSKFAQVPSGEIPISVHIEKIFFNSQHATETGSNFSLSHPWQTRDTLKKFMESLMAKTGKLRSLVRELESK